MAKLGHRYTCARNGDSQVPSPGSSNPDQQHPPTPPNPSIQRRRGLVSDAATPFSWVQCAISTFAYVWMLSNFLRTGFAIHSLDGFTSIEPNVRISFGPYAYPMSAIFRNGVEDLSNVTSADPVALWGYKYDTTSLDMRAFAGFLNVSAFPDCVLYKGKCTSEFFAPATALAMLDSLVDAVRNASRFVTTLELPTQDPTYHRFQPQKMLLRASYDYFDRVHHYMLPQLFSSPNWRTCEAAYYSPELLFSVAASSSIDSVGKPLRDQGGDNNNNNTLVDICSYAYDGVRPYFCDELWTRFDHSCSESDAECRAIGHVSTHTMQRLEAFKASNPDATVDLLILNGSDDLNINRGGFTFVAKRGFDVVTIFRARSCSQAGACETQVLDEYRYEGETFTSDILQWYPIVATLRGAAQSYYWLRLVMLYCGCYYAVAATSKGSPSQSPALSRARRATTAFFKIPSQVIVYGSAFPLVCYVSAHIIDSPMVYELMAQKFDSFNGLFQLSLTELITIGSLQMRNVWLLANVIHIVVLIATRRRWLPMHGVWGMPQFTIAVISSLTICSQFRFLSLRQTPVKRILHLQVTSRLHPGLDSILHVNGGGGKAQLAGIFLDAKALVCSVALLGLIAAVVSLTLRVICTKLNIKFVFLRAHSTTPLSAGVLWPATGLAVCWSDDLIQTRQASHHIAAKQPQPFSIKIQPAKPPLASGGSPVKARTLDDRSEAEESEMYLMNITMLSDPIAYLLWQWSSSATRIDYYRSTATQQVYLVPRVHTSHQSELSWRGFTLEKTVSADELTWFEIITCG